MKNMLICLRKIFKSFNLSVLRVNDLFYCDERTIIYLNVSVYIHVKQRSELFVLKIYQLVYKMDILFLIKGKMGTLKNLK